MYIVYCTIFITLHCNEKWLRNVKLRTFNTKEQQPQSVSSEQKWCRKTCKIMKADYSCASKSLPRPGQCTVTREAQGNISQQGQRHWIKPHRRANNLDSGFLEIPLGRKKQIVKMRESLKLPSQIFPPWSWWFSFYPILKATHKYK